MGRVTRLGGLGLLIAGALPPAPGRAGPLDAYRWRARVLVVSAAKADDPHLAAQRRLLAAARPALTERDLVVLEAVGAAADAHALRAALGLPDEGFRAVLVGKDGGAKLTRSEPIPVAALTATIDAMPMRREEMRR